MQNYKYDKTNYVLFLLILNIHKESLTIIVHLNQRVNIISKINILFICLVFNLLKISIRFTKYIFIFINLIIFLFFSYLFYFRLNIF